MKTERASSRLQRVLVAIDHAEDDPAMLDEAARLAAGLGVELVGVFVEQGDLMAAAALPVSRLVPYHLGRRAESMDVALMRRALKAHFDRARRAMVAAAARWRVHCSFYEHEDGSVDGLMTIVRGGDLLTMQMRRTRLGPSSKTIATNAPCSVLLLERKRESGRPVMVIDQGLGAGFELGRLIAAIQSSDLVVLVAGADAKAVEERLSEIRGMLGSEEKAVELCSLVAPTTEALNAAFRRYRPGVVIVDRGGGLGSLIDQTVESVGCSILSLH